MARVGVTVTGELSVREVADVAAAAEESGCESFWMHETYYYRDAWTALTAAALRLRRMTVGTGCIGPFTRHPAVIAMAVASLMDVAPGRVILGLGTGYSGRLDEMAIPRSGRIDGMRAAVGIVRALCAGQAAGPLPPFLDGPIRLAFSPREVPPVYVAGWGRRMLRLCGEQGDGYLARPVESALSLRRLMARIREVAAAAGRSSGAIDMAANILCHVEPDGASARAAARRAPFLLYQFSVIDEAVLAESGIDPAVRGRIAAALRAGDPAAAGRDVSDTMLEAFTAVGTPAEVSERLQAFREAGVALPVLQPLLRDSIPGLLQTAAMIARE